METGEMVLEAVRLQETGRIPEAEQLFKAVLEKNPADFVAWYSLGAIAFNRGENERAIESFERAKAVRVDVPVLWYNLALALGASGRFLQALAHLDRFLALEPANASALSLRTTYSARLAESSRGAANGEDRAAKMTRALELQSGQRLDEAETLLWDLVMESSTDCPSLYTLGVIAQQRGQSERALRLFQRCLELKPEFPPLWFNCGAVLQALRRHEDSLRHYDRALALDPVYKEALLNRGALLLEMKRHKDALLNYEEMIRIDPDNDKALYNRGIILGDFKLGDMAIETFSRLLQVNPDYEYGIGHLCYAKMHACDWSGIEPLITKVIEGVRAGKRVCKSQGFLGISDEPRDHLICSQTFARQYFPAKDPMWRGETYSRPRIRVAYMSPDLREHPVGHLTAGIFENHDKSRFEITAISLGIDDNSRLRSRMLAAFDRFVDAREIGSRDIAAMLRAQEIDILVDLAGYTADSRTEVLAWRPVPCQVNFLGYSSTMGVDYVDYIIADRQIIPEATRDCFSEKVVYMPDTYLPTDSTIRIADESRSREEYGLPPTGFVFCSFNHDYKINPPMFDLWMRLLKAVPGSVLWLMKLNEQAERNLRREATARGVDPARLIFATRVPRVEDHLARYRRADLFLDTSPYNAHSTTSDVLRAGLPVLTCRGKSFVGRVAASLLQLVGIPELVTESLEQYEALALRLAQDESFLQAVRRKLAKNLETTVLYDTRRFCRNLERAFELMVERSRRGLPPDHFTVDRPG